MANKGISAETVAEISKFVSERNWKQFHTPKDMAISISLEAAELLEIFQWSGKDVEVDEKRSRMEEELADVLICSIEMAQSLNFDLEEIIKRKMTRNKEKYPVAKAYGTAKKYTEL